MTPIEAIRHLEARHGVEEVTRTKHNRITVKHALVKIGPVKVKRYTLTRRAGDGHIVYRWGRIVAATHDPSTGVVVFIPADQWDGHLQWGAK